jgi:hypothetical protein
VAAVCWPSAVVAVVCWPSAGAAAKSRTFLVDGWRLRSVVLRRRRLSQSAYTSNPDSFKKKYSRRNIVS